MIYRSDMRIHVVDAFADRPFTGNPAAVCLLSEPAGADWMQRVAMEMNLSETAFPRPVEDADADFELRWFTPEVEVALCGHATLGSAHVLYETGAAPADRPIRFRTLHNGVLTVRRSDDMLAMDFPAMPARPIEAPEGLAAALGVVPEWTGRSDQDDLLVLLDNPAAVRSLAPDMEGLRRLGAAGFCVTAADPGERDAFVSRFFAPGAGIPEDPVTGSAHCMLAPFWAPRLGRADMVGRQLSARGGTVGVSVRGDRVTLTGRAVSVLDGTLRVVG